MLRNTFTLALLLSVPTGALANEPAAPVGGAPQVAALRGGSRLISLEIGTTALMANNVLPLPGLGLGILFEQGMFGISGAVAADAGTYCDRPGGEGYCGMLWIGDVAPRFTPLPERQVSPYVAARLQLTRDDIHGLVPALGPRLGLRYRGQRVGFYLDGGPSFVRAEDKGFTGYTRRWFAQLSTGVTVTLW